MDNYVPKITDALFLGFALLVGLSIGVGTSVASATSAVDAAFRIAVAIGASVAAIALLWTTPRISRFERELHAEIRRVQRWQSGRPEPVDSSEQRRAA